MYKAALLLASVAVSSVAITQAEAAPVVYTIAGNGSGSLNGTSFNDAAFTFTLRGDTANLTDYGFGQAVDPLASASVSIAGFGSSVISIPTRLGVAGGGTVVFFSRAGFTGADLFDFDLASPVDLSRSFGPLAGLNVFALNQFQNVATTGGALSFDAASGVTFAGTAAAVPEPATWSLMIAGFAIAGAALRRRVKVGYAAA